MEKETYNGKTHLLITYQWDVATGTQDAIIVRHTFDTRDDAFDELDEVVGIGNMMFDDGYPVIEWNKALADGEDDVFLQYNFQIDSRRNILAVLSPVNE